jgi:hypothetical protein
MPQQTMINIYGQGYMQTTPSFPLQNFTSAQYTSRGNDRPYTHASGNYQAPYTTVAYTNPIPLPSSLLGFLLNHTYQNAPWFNAYGQPKTGSFGYETPPQFLFRPQSIEMMPPRAMAEPGTDPNNLTNQLDTILHESFGIEPKD